MTSLFQLFFVFAKIGAFTIGGGYAMIPIIQDEIVKRCWLKEDDFPDIIALAQSAPGILAVNISIFIGYRLKGIRGSIVATLGSILPSFLIILAIAALAAGYRENEVINRIFMGIRPAVVALIAVPMVGMARKNRGRWWSWLIMAAALGLTAFLKISPIYILITIMVAAIAIVYSREHRRK